MTEIEKLKAVLKELIKAAEPFLDDEVVVVTSGTIPLLRRLEKAIENTEDWILD